MVAAADGAASANGVGRATNQNRAVSTQAKAVATEMKKLEASLKALNKTIESKPWAERPNHLPELHAQGVALSALSTQLRKLEPGFQCPPSLFAKPTHDALTGAHAAIASGDMTKLNASLKDLNRTLENFAANKRLGFEVPKGLVDNVAMMKADVVAAQKRLGAGSVR